MYREFLRQVLRPLAAEDRQELLPTELLCNAILQHALSPGTRTLHEVVQEPKHIYHLLSQYAELPPELSDATAITLTAC